MFLESGALWLHEAYSSNQGEGRKFGLKKDDEQILLSSRLLAWKLIIFISNIGYNFTTLLCALSPPIT